MSTCRCKLIDFMIYHSCFIAFVWIMDFFEVTSTFSISIWRHLKSAIRPKYRCFLHIRKYNLNNEFSVILYWFDLLSSIVGVASSLINDNFMYWHFTWNFIHFQLENFLITNRPFLYDNGNKNNNLELYEIIIHCSKKSKPNKYLLWRSR